MRYFFIKEKIEEGEIEVDSITPIGFPDITPALARARERLRAASGLFPLDRPPEEFKAVFDSLSFTKARVLLLYWDWFTRKAGPYASAT